MPEQFLAHAIISDLVKHHMKNESLAAYYFFCLLVVLSLFYMCMLLFVVVCFPVLVTNQRL